MRKAKVALHCFCLVARHNRFELLTLPIRISGGRCYHDKFRTIMDCIVVNNPVVMNCLIDQKSIERVLIIDSDRDAMQILKDQRTVPKNLLFAYTLQFNQYYPAPSYR